MKLKLLQLTLEALDENAMIAAASIGGNWIDAQASVARANRKYMASWLTRLARAIENGEHRQDGGT